VNVLQECVAWIIWSCNSSIFEKRRV